MADDLTAAQGPKRLCLVPAHLLLHKLHLSLAGARIHESVQLLREDLGGGVGLAARRGRAVGRDVVELGI